VQEIRNAMQEDGSSVQVTTFSLAQEERRRGLMITVRAHQLVNDLTAELYNRGRDGSQVDFGEVVNLPSIRWIDKSTLSENFTVGDDESDRVDLASDEREIIRSRVQSIVNETLIRQIVSQLRDTLVDNTTELDLNWASEQEMLQALRDSQSESLTERILNTEVNSIEDLEPLLSDYEISSEEFSEIFSVGEGTRDQVDLTDLDKDDLHQIIKEEFFQDRYQNLVREIIDAREQEGLFRSPKQFYQLEAVDSLYQPALKETVYFSPFVLIRSEMVSPSIGSELIGKSALAILVSLVGILLYLYIRFELTYSLGAIVAIIHDVVITIGLLTLMAVEFDVSVVAAVLTVIGYSLNDTIVNFDRVRENRTLMGYKASWYDVINRSVYEVLNRTFVTSITTFLAVLVLYIYGGIALEAFSITLIIGVIVGTYSSIFVSNLSLYHLQKSLRDT